LFGRYYFGGSDDYVELNATRGVLVDARWYNLTTYDNVQQPSYFGGLIVQKSIRRKNLININMAVYQQQYLPGAIGNQYQAGIGYTRRF
jgi:hypothetical protein